DEHDRADEHFFPAVSGEPKHTPKPGRAGGNVNWRLSPWRGRAYNDCSMAKAKKATSSAPKKTSKKSGAPAQPAGTPLIDTSLAAEQAAQLLAAKVEAPPAAAAAPKPESSLFKKLKEGLN